MYWNVIDWLTEIDMTGSYSREDILRTSNVCLAIFPMRADVNAGRCASVVDPDLFVSAGNEVRVSSSDFDVVDGLDGAGLVNAEDFNSGVGRKRKVISFP